MSCISANDLQLSRLADAIAQRVGQQRFHVWFNNSTRLDLTADGLEIAVPNDFISEWIGRNFSRPIQEAAHEVLGCPLPVRFSISPELFGTEGDPLRQTRRNTHSPEVARPALMDDETPGRRPMNGKGHDNGNGNGRPRANGNGLSHANGESHGAVNGNGKHAEFGQTDMAHSARLEASGTKTARLPARAALRLPSSQNGSTAKAEGEAAFSARPKLRHHLDTFIVGPTNQLAYNATLYVSEFPGSNYNPLFIHGACGLGKTHLLQGLCRKFSEFHPNKRWLYLTGEEFTNEFISALRNNKLDGFRRKMRDLDLLVIDDVHFLGGKKATQEEFLHTFNAIEAMGKQVVMASDNHPKLIEEFGESLVNRFVSGMVVRVDPPNYQTRVHLLRSMSDRLSLGMSEDVLAWVARRVTQNVRELEGAITRIGAYVRLTGTSPDIGTAQVSLGDLNRQHVAPISPENVMQAVCAYFSIEPKDLMSGGRQRTISLARSVAMYLVRKTGKMSFPEIGLRMGKRNHSTVISACRRIEGAIEKNQHLIWTSSVGEREEEAVELLQRLEDHSRSIG